MYQKSGPLSVNLSKYASVGHCLKDQSSNFTLYSTKRNQGSITVLLPPFQTSKSVKAADSLPKTPIAAPTTRKHNSMGRLSHEKSCSRLKNHSESRRELGKKSSQVVTTRVMKKSDSYLRLRLDSGRNSANSKYKMQTKRLTLKEDRRNSNQHQNATELKRLKNDFDCKSNAKFDNAIEELLRQPKQAGSLTELVAILQNRLVAERKMTAYALDSSNQRCKSKEAELTALRVEIRSLRNELQLANITLKELNSKNDRKRSLKSTPTQTRETITSEQYKEYIAELDRKFEESKLQQAIYLKMLHLAESEHHINLGQLYQRTKEQQDNFSDSSSSLKLFQKKITVDVSNNSSAQADISIVNDSDETSFNFIGKSLNDESYFQLEVEHKSKENGKKDIPIFQKPIKLNLELLNRSSPRSEDD